MGGAEAENDIVLEIQLLLNHSKYVCIATSRGMYTSLIVLLCYAYLFTVGMAALQNLCVRTNPGVSVHKKYICIYVHTHKYIY